MKLRELVTISVLSLLPLAVQSNVISVQVKGMVCGFCAQGIEKKLKTLPEVSKVNVSLETKFVGLELKEGKDVSDDQLKKIITDSGYEVVKIERPK